MLDDVSDKNSLEMKILAHIANSIEIINISGIKFILMCTLGDLTDPLAR